MKTWQCFGCSYQCKCETEDSVYCIPKKCLVYELHAPNWQSVEEEKNGGETEQKAD